jgi:hypothetical protein
MPEEPADAGPARAPREADAAPGPEGPPSTARPDAADADGQPPAPQADARPAASSIDTASALASALARASALALSETPLQDLSVTVLEDLRRALRLRQAALCLRALNGTLRARFAVGPVSAAVIQHFAVNPGSRQDLFALLCEHGRDTFISDATQPTVSAHLPAWFKAHVGAGTFVLLPMVSGRRVVGLLYADAAEPGSLPQDERLLGQVGTLRNQLLLAMRLRGKA